MAPNSFTHSREGSDHLPQPVPSFSRPIRSDSNESNAETLHDIPLNDRYPSPLSHSMPQVPRPSVDSNGQSTPTSTRLAEIRAEMRMNQSQIQQLTDAHRAVQNAVSGISATQELLRFSPNRANGLAGDDLGIPQRAGTNKSVNSRYGEYKSQFDRPEEPFRQAPGADRQSWIDDDYYDSNPWYGMPKDKPVFSLGKPLPHTSRGVSRPERKPQEGAEAAAESGRAGLPSKKSKRVRMADSGEGIVPAASTDEDRQPLYDHAPWEADVTVPDLNKQQEKRQGEGQEEGKKYGVDREPIGQREDAEAEEGKTDPNDLRNWWARIRAKYPEPLAEFLCTLMSVFLGLGATLSVNLSKNQSSQYGTYETACWAWGFAFMFGIYLGGGVSGAHMNPAISISLSIYRGFPWKQCLVYIVAQFIASIAAGGLAYSIYYDAIHYVDPTLTQTYTSFFSYPQSWVSNTTAFMSQFVASAIMMIAVFALGDDQNNPPGAGMHAFILGMLVTTLKFTMGYNTGSALNPASDFGPRLVALWAGYQSPEIFHNSWWVYGPWAGTLAGSFAGCTLYDSFIFVGSESPVNYRIPEAFRKRAGKLLRLNGRK